MENFQISSKHPPASYFLKIPSFSQLENSTASSDDKYQSRLFSSGGYNWYVFFLCIRTLLPDLALSAILCFIKEFGGFLIEKKKILSCLFFVTILANAVMLFSIFWPYGHHIRSDSDQPILEDINPILFK